VEKSTVRRSDVELPAESKARTVIALEPAARGIEALQDVVPPALPVAPLAAFDQVTVPTPTLSAAVPATVRGVELDVQEADVVGELIVMEGGVVSPAGGV